METVGYTETETAQIAEWVAAGLTYTEIAANLPGRTKSGIWHKVHGMGLSAKRQKRGSSERSRRDYFRRVIRESEHHSDNSNLTQDISFQDAMRKAIAAGLEFAEEGVSLVPCTENPILVRPPVIMFSRSSALMCAEHGDRQGAY